MFSDLRQRGEKIIFVGPEKRIGGGAGRDHSRYFAAHKFCSDLLFGDAGIFHLLADGNFETFADELANVAFGGVVRYSAHGHSDAFFFVT